MRLHEPKGTTQVKLPTQWVDRPVFEPTFMEHRGIRVLRLDYTGLAPKELPGAFQVAVQVITAEPLGSLRILSLFESRFDQTGAEALKGSMVKSRHHVRRSAVVTSGFWKVVVTSIKLHRRRDLGLFDSQAAALDWLVQS